MFRVLFPCHQPLPMSSVTLCTSSHSLLVSFSWIDHRYCTSAFVSRTNHTKLVQTCIGYAPSQFARVTMGSRQDSAGRPHCNSAALHNAILLLYGLGSRSGFSSTSCPLLYFFLHSVPSADRFAAAWAHVVEEPTCMSV